MTIVTVLPGHGIGPDIVDAIIRVLEELDCGLGLRPGANIGDNRGIFEAVHGSALDIPVKISLTPQHCCWLPR
jgi:isocitrate/isopropylmalate dehydrogenase